MRKLRKVLLVDDEASTNFLHQTLIEDAGITEQIALAYNGEEALDLLDNDDNQPELILLDINMPVMNGIEFLEKYEKLPDEKKNQVVVVMLTTSLLDKDKKTAEGYSCVKEYISKPLTEESIAKIMAHFQ